MAGAAARSPGLRELVEQGAEVERLATGFVFTEGPVWHPTGGYLLFSDIPADRRWRWHPDRGARVERDPAGMGNGMTYDAGLDLIVCEHATSSVVRERPDGTRETVASHFRGAELNSPNDVCVRSDGSLYFSDPWYGRMPVFGVERERVLGFQGVFRIPPRGGEPELLVAEGELSMPNGLCFSPDESLLYVDDTPRAHVKAFDVAAGGSLSNGRVFCEGIGTGDLAEGVVDGMKCDERGNVWVTGPGGVWVFSPGGELLGVVEVPEVVANLAWGGRDWRTLFLTARTSLYGLRTAVGPRGEPYMGARP